MDFHDFPSFPGKSGCISHPTPQDVCRPIREVRALRAAVATGKCAADAQSEGADRSGCVLENRFV